MTFEKGKSYKTVGGWEAICIGLDPQKELTFVHKTQEFIAVENHDKAGNANDADQIYNVTTEPYTEPRKGVVWVNVYDDKSADAFTHIGSAKAAQEQYHLNCIARKAVPFTEGEYDE